MKNIYFLRPVGAEGPIKIGCSINPAGRLATILIWSPLPLEIVATVEGGHEYERMLHERFAAARVHGEWFQAVPELVELVAGIAAGNPLPALPSKTHRCNRDPSAEILRKARQIYETGATAATVAERLGVSIQKATKLIRLSGATMRPRGLYYRPFRVDDARRAAEFHRLRRAGFTLNEIGTRYGLTRERVRQILEKTEDHRAALERLAA